MGCVKCNRSMRTTYIGNQQRAYRGDYCFKCKPTNNQKNKKVQE